MRCPLVSACRVPARLEPITSVRADAEVQPRDVGMRRADVEAIWAGVERIYRSGIHPAMQLCVRRHGLVVLDRAIGHARGNGPDDPPDAPKTLATPDTPFCIFSATKAVTSMLVHLLDERDLIRIDDPLCEYIPEFGIHTKQWITIRHLLIHRAGIPNPPPEAMQLDLLQDQQRIVRILYEQEQLWRPGRWLAYHAITGGFLLGELIRRVTGKDIRVFLDEELRRPLGMRFFTYCTAPEDVPRVALNYFTGPPPIPPLSIMLRRALGVDFRTVVEMSNDPRFHAGLIPAGNLVCTADELSRFYQVLLDDGRSDGQRIFARRTIRRATIEQSYFEFDFTLALPFRYSMGFMLGAKWFSLYGPDTGYAFGHLGFTNIIAWADPERDLSVALLTSGKPLIYPELYDLWNLLRQIGGACPKVRGPIWSPAVASA